MDANNGTDTGTESTGQRILHFSKALLPVGWRDNVEVTIDGGRISRVVPDAKPASQAERRHEFALPGMTNAHSHAFQRALAGSSEYRTAERDSFWTWRTLMYRFLESLTPDDVSRIARRLYADMARAGYTCVVEFHYLLHQPDGTPYDHVNEMADRLIEAALESGLRICMIPVCYQRGGFDDSPLQGGQRRFGSTVELYLQMLERLSADWRDHPCVRLGVALHSLRAVSVEQGQRVVEPARGLLPQCPLHIHVAEQTAEVDACLAATGARPVELLLDSFDVDGRWCLIHATHMTREECRGVARQGAVICVCPTTEANLGDGLFRAEEYLIEDRGQLAIGGDSHVSVDPCEELRWLEYGQRLNQQRRAVLCDPPRSCGQFLYETAAVGGAVASGFETAELKPGTPAAFTLVDPSSVETIIDNEGGMQDAARAVSHERLLDMLLFRTPPIAGRARALVFTS